LLVAQDTGGAIRGPVRGDVYWGSTARAESVAGRMAHKGQLYVLVPKAVAARLN
jgi:membrane-bound lytic murein transglycosylase A